MNLVIWKYSLEIVGEQHLFLPGGAEILSVQMQGNELCLWALVNPGISPERRIIEIIGTGNPTSIEEREFIGTVQMKNGQLVWHVFEK